MKRCAAFTLLTTLAVSAVSGAGRELTVSVDGLSPAEAVENIRAAKFKGDKDAKGATPHLDALRLGKVNAKINDVNKQLNELSSKMENLDKNQKDAINMYIKYSYVHARKLGVRETKFTTKDFLPWPDNLPEELSYAYLYNAKMECDKVAKAEKESKKTRKTNKAQ